MKSLIALLGLIIALSLTQWASAEEGVKEKTEAFGGIGLQIQILGAKEIADANKEDKDSPEIMKISEDHPLVVKDVLSNSPAEKAGMKSGDRIIKIDGVNVNGLNVEQAALKIRGETDTKVTITVLGKDQNEQSIAITRAIIQCQ